MLKIIESSGQKSPMDPRETAKPRPETPGKTPKAAAAPGRGNCPRTLVFSNETTFPRNPPRRRRRREPVGFARVKPSVKVQKAFYTTRLTISTNIAAKREPRPRKSEKTETRARNRKLVPAAPNIPGSGTAGGRSRARDSVFQTKQGKKHIFSLLFCEKLDSVRRLLAKTERILQEKENKIHKKARRGTRRPDGPAPPRPGADGAFPAGPTRPKPARPASDLIRGIDSRRVFKDAFSAETRVFRGNPPAPRLPRRVR
jgi:hypothetical protein